MKRWSSMYVYICTYITILRTCTCPCASIYMYTYECTYINVHVVHSIPADTAGEQATNNRTESAEVYHNLVSETEYLVTCINVHVCFFIHVHIGC